MLKINKKSFFAKDKRTDIFYIEIPLTINTYDIDVAGHVNNIVYIRWVEQLRIKLFKEYFNLQELMLNNHYPVVISTSITYKRALKLFDKPIGNLNLSCFNHGIITLKFKINLKEKTAAFGEQRCVLMDLNNGKINKEKFKFFQMQNV